jgi:hypothetical protein
LAHKHWPKDHPFYERAATCQLTVKACDALWTAYQHRHEGVLCVKEVLPGNVMATCILQYTPADLEARRSKRVRYNENTSAEDE